MINSTLTTWLTAARPRAGLTKVSRAGVTFVRTTGWQSRYVSQFSTTRFGALATAHAENWSRART